MAKMPEQKPFRSKQDYGTPRKFLDAVEKKFGKIVFDLAAHKGNAVCEKYFAPDILKYVLNPKKIPPQEEVVQYLLNAGGNIFEVKEKVGEAYELVKNLESKVTISVSNTDALHSGFDSLSKDWRQIRLSGNYFLNPEYEDIAPWAEKCAKTDPLSCCFNSDYSFRIPLLIPASVGTNYWAEFIHNKAQVHFLNPRLSFDGIAPYPKDLCVCLYGLKPGYECWRWDETNT